MLSRRLRFEWEMNLAGIALRPGDVVILAPDYFAHGSGQSKRNLYRHPVRLERVELTEDNTVKCAGIWWDIGDYGFRGANGFMGIDGGFNDPDSMSDPNSGLLFGGSGLEPEFRLGKMDLVTRTKIDRVLKPQR